MVFYILFSVFCVVRDFSCFFCILPAKCRVLWVGVAPALQLPVKLTGPCRGRMSPVVGTSHSAPTARSVGGSPSSFFRFHNILPPRVACATSAVQVPSEMSKGTRCVGSVSLTPQSGAGCGGAVQACFPLNARCVLRTMRLRPRKL